MIRQRRLNYKRRCAEGLCVKTMFHDAEPTSQRSIGKTAARTAQPSTTNHERHQRHEKVQVSERQTTRVHAPPARHQCSNGKTAGRSEIATEAKPRDIHVSITIDASIPRAAARRTTNQRSKAFVSQRTKTFDRRNSALFG